MERVTIFCFAASYGVALILELWRLIRPLPAVRLVSLFFGGAGLLAHTIYVVVQGLPLESPAGSLLFLAWILAVFYLYGSIHHARLAWGLFVLPLVLGLTALAALFPARISSAEPAGIYRFFDSFRGESVWGAIHGSLLILAAVGICVGFIASLMYLVQAQRLKAKIAPAHGMRLLSLERLEEMNRRAVLAAFPLLTVGLLVGVALSGSFSQGWTNVKILSTLGLWIVFTILLYLRYGARARGRAVAWLTVVAFGFLVVALVSVHPFVAD